MKRVMVAVIVGWLNLNAWSETYVGAYWLSEVELPAINGKRNRITPPGANAVDRIAQFVEIALLSSIQAILKAAPGKFPRYEKRFPDVPFNKAFTRWPQGLGCGPFDLAAEPFLSVDRLRKRRNWSINFGSALTTLAMARSALFSAVDGSKAITWHLLGPDAFRYEAALTKYPLAPQPVFSGVAFPN